MKNVIEILKKRNLHYMPLIVMLLIFTGCAKEMIYKTTWQNTPVTIDGQTDDWTEPLRFIDPTTKLNYSVSNDANNLYIFIRSKDKVTISGITKMGLQLWIDTTGKKTHQVGIICPMPQKNAYVPDKNDSYKNGRNYNNGEQQSSSNNGDEDTAKENHLHRRFQESIKQMHVSGFKDIPDGQLDLPDNYGINLGINWTNSTGLIYEVAIPIKSFLSYPLAPSDTSRIIGISLNFTITPQSKYTRGGGGGMGFGFGMGGLMLGMGGGEGGGGGPGGVSSPQPEAIWTPFHLIVK